MHILITAILCVFLFFIWLRLDLKVVRFIIKHSHLCTPSTTRCLHLLSRCGLIAIQVSGLLLDQGEQELIMASRTRCKRTKPYKTLPQTLTTSHEQDVFAILLAAHHPSLNLLGITTVHGNSSLANTTANAGSVLEAIGRPDIPVYPGSKKPFSRVAVHAPDIHGRYISMTMVRMNSF
jgi:hypothetical protein